MVRSFTTKTQTRLYLIPSTNSNCYSTRDARERSADLWLLHYTRLPSVNRVMICKNDGGFNFENVAQSNLRTEPFYGNARMRVQILAAPTKTKKKTPSWQNISRFHCYPKIYIFIFQLQKSKNNIILKFSSCSYYIILANIAPSSFVSSQRVRFLLP